MCVCVCACIFCSENLNKINSHLECPYKFLLL